MSRKKRRKKGRKKPNLSPNQLLYNKELERLYNRIEYWKVKKGLLFTDIPERPKKIHQKDIEALRNIRLDNFNEQQLEQYRKEYKYRTNYNPPTESDFYNGVETAQPDEPEWDDSWGEQSPEPSLTVQEMEAWIEEKIDSILNPTLIEREREGAKELLRTIIENAKDQIGTKGFYEFLQDPENAGKLEAAAHAYLQSYQKKNGTDTGGPALEQFTETLNLGRPLTDEQAYELQTYGTVNFDYSDTGYD